MTREIKFRAWDKIGETMVYQDRITIAENGNWILISKPGNDFGGRGIPLMQFTGLKDKNGKEIYESDKLKDLDGDIGVVEFDDGCFIIRHQNGTSDFIATKNHFEIMGNIYEN